MVKQRRPKTIYRNLIRKPSLWIYLALILLPFLIPGIWYYRQVRQRRLDHALIEAVMNQDPQTAIALLDRGANANAEYMPESPMRFENLLEDYWNQITGHGLPQDGDHHSSALTLLYTSHYLPRTSPLPRHGPASYAPLVQVLLAKGASPYAMDPEGDTVLHNAVQSDSDTVRVLLQHHVNPNIKSKDDGATPLMRSPSDDCARLLVEYGADVNARDKEGKTPFMFHPSLLICQLFIEHAAKLNVQDASGRTALHFATDSQELAFVRFLLAHGAKVSIKDNQGKTALDSAKEMLADAKKRSDIEECQLWEKIISLLEKAARKEQTQKNSR